ncbi:MAG: hypothetical protein ACTSU5_08555 [Promethearchaeota archaeon]
MASCEFQEQDERGSQDPVEPRDIMDDGTVVRQFENRVYLFQLYLAHGRAGC